MVRMFEAMTIRNTRRLLWLLATLSCIAAVVVVIRGVTADDSDQFDTKTFKIQNTVDNTSDATPGLKLRDLEPLWSLRLQQPLYDPPPVVVAEPKFVPPPLGIRLLGTIVEPDNSQAILMAADGEIVFQRVGQTVGDATIESITADAITVTYYEEILTLNISEE